MTPLSRTKLAPSSIGLLLIVGGCSVGSERLNAKVDVGTQALIYGSDDRVEADAASVIAWQTAGVRRSVALVPMELIPVANIDVDAGFDDGGVEPAATGVTAAERFQLCPEERFRDQMSSSDCSGVLLTADVVLTAGHCFADGEDCNRYRYVLGNSQHAGIAGTLAEIQCSRLILREVGQLADGSQLDYALVRLAQSVPDIDPVAIASADAVVRGERVSTFGFPLGVPLKIDPNGLVLTADRTGFNLTTDAYHGSSGSAVYGATGSLAGILTGGQSDFDRDVARECNVSRVLAEAEAGAGERAMSAAVAVARTCHQISGLALCAALAAPRMSRSAGAGDAQAVRNLDSEKTAMQAATTSVPSDAGSGGEDRRADMDSSGGSAHPTARGATQHALRRHSSGCAVTAVRNNCSTGTTLAFVWLTTFAFRRRWRSASTRRDRAP